MRSFKHHSSCLQDPEVQGALCNSTFSECNKGQSLTIGNGPMTGRCVPSAAKPKLSVCEIAAWCPVEMDILPL